MRKFLVVATFGIMFLAHYDKIKKNSLEIYDFLKEKYDEFMVRRDIDKAIENSDDRHNIN